MALVFQTFCGPFLLLSLVNLFKTENRERKKIGRQSLATWNTGTPRITNQPLGTQTRSLHFPLTQAEDTEVSGAHSSPWSESAAETNGQGQDKNPDDFFNYKHKDIFFEFLDHT